MKIKIITKTMLKSAAQEFYEWYGVKIPMNIMIQFSRTVSYDDIHFFDTTTRENLSSFIGQKITGMDWPTGRSGEIKSNKFFKKLKKNAPKYKVKCDW